MTSPTQAPPGRRSPASHEFPSGPDIGERLPPIRLADQHGNLVDFEEARAGRRALVVFHRSVRW